MWKYFERVGKLWQSRSSHRRCPAKKFFFRNFAEFTGKHLRQSLFFNEVVGLKLQACNFIKKTLWLRCFPVNFPKFLRIRFLQNTFERLLLPKLQALINLPTSSNYSMANYGNFQSFHCFEREIKN